MGWNSWDCYGASVTEDTVRKNAEFMAENLKQYGWEYVVVDIQWYQPTAKSHEYEPFADLCMDEYGRLWPAPNRFPSAVRGAGFKPLADYIHSLGLKFGIHIMRGIPRQAVHMNTPVFGADVKARQIARFNSICNWNPDMYGVDVSKGGECYYASIFELYADWGVDFIKVDDICRELPHEEPELLALSHALSECGRDIVLSLSPGPALIEKAELYKRTANMWRITDDFWDKWELLYDMFSRAEKWSIHTGPGNYPDADMLPVGPILQDYDKNSWTKFTEDEQITMMSLWCIFRAPLMIGGEMTGFDDFTMKLITNADILDMQMYARHSHQVWRKEIGGIEHILWTAMDARGGQYMAVFNVGEKDSNVSISLSDVEADAASTAKELWSGEVSEAGAAIEMSIPKHGAKVYKLL